MIINGLFPTPVAHFNIGRDLTEEESSFIKNLKTHANMGNTTSDDSNLFENRELKNIADFCQTSIDEFFKRIYAPEHEVSLYITQSWANYTEPGQFHHKHQHPNSFVSGVFYVQADSEKDKIHFYRDDYPQLKVMPKEFNAFNSESWWVPTATGDLYLFPSSLTHMVERTQSEQTRISLSFNTFLKGYVGQDKSLTGLHL